MSEADPLVFADVIYFGYFLTLGLGVFVTAWMQIDSAAGSRSEIGMGGTNLSKKDRATDDKRWFWRHAQAGGGKALLPGWALAAFSLIALTAGNAFPLWWSWRTYDQESWLWQAAMGLGISQAVVAIAAIGVFFYLSMPIVGTLVWFLVFCAIGTTDGLLWTLPSLGTEGVTHTYVAPGIMLVAVLWAGYMFVAAIVFARASNARRSYDEPANALGSPTVALMVNT